MRRTLAVHAAAQLHHDRAAYDAGLWSSSRAAGFRARQDAAYANLVQLPLATWSYRYDVPTDDPDAAREASKNYGQPTRIVHVVVRYALRGFDAMPTEHDLYLSFVRSDGKVVLAGDTDLDEYGGQSWRGPWDFGPLRIATGARSLVIGHQAQADQLPGIAADIDAAIPRVSAVVGTGWPQRVAALVPASSDELAADAGPTATITADVPAITVSDSADPLTRAALGLRLIVNPPALAKLSTLGRGVVVRHEITHLALGAVTSDASPRWLVEGFADYVGQLDIPQPVTTIAAELRVDIRAGKLPSALPAEQQFDAQATAAKAYEQSWLACRLIAKDAGQAGLVRFYRLVGQSYDPQTAVATALRTVLRESTATFTVQWRAYLRAELG